MNARHTAVYPLPPLSLGSRPDKGSTPVKMDPTSMNLIEIFPHRHVQSYFQSDYGFCQIDS